MFRVLVLLLAVICCCTCSQSQALHAHSTFAHRAFKVANSKVVNCVKYLHRPVSFYPNSSATFTISILLCGDIELNPGPSKTERECNKSQRKLRSVDQSNGQLPNGNIDNGDVNLYIAQNPSFSSILFASFHQGNEVFNEHSYLPS